MGSLHWKFFIVLIFANQSAMATLAPRMYTIMAQMSGSIYQISDIAGNTSYNNKISLELLYLVREGPTFGGRYIYESRNENESNVGQAYGPMAGYYTSSGFFVLFNYDILAKLGRWTNGEGAEASAGYLEHIGDQMHIGAKFSVRKIRYKTDITNNTAVNKNVSDQFPSLMLMYLF